MQVEDEHDVADTVGSFMVVELADYRENPMTEEDWEDKVCGLCVAITLRYVHVQIVDSNMVPNGTAVIIPWRNIEKISVVSQERAKALFAEDPEMFN